jgi:hypothetical protein
MASAAENGQFEIQFSDKSESNPKVVFSNHTSVISGGAKAAPTAATLEAIPRIAEGQVIAARTPGRVIVRFIADAADTIESEESQFEISGFLYDMKGNLVRGQTLTQENMTGFTQAGTVDAVCAAGVPTRLCYWDVPLGLNFGLNPNGKVRAYIGDDTA